MKLTTLSTFVLTIGLATTGCSKKKDAPAADKPATTEAAKPAEAPKATEAAKPAETPTPTEAAKPAAGGDVTFTTDDEYIAEGKAALGKILDTFKAAGTDCEKLAAGLSSLSSDPKFKASTAYEKAHPEVKKKFEEVAKAETQKFMEVAAPAMQACANNKALADALTKLSE